LASSRREAALGLFRSIAFALLVLAIPVALVTTNIRFATSDVRVYDYSVREYNAAAAARIPESELITANRQLRSYLTGGDTGPLHIVVTDTNGQRESLFNARETAHLADVRDLIQGLFTVQVLALVLTLTLVVVLLATAPLRTLARAFLYGSFLTMALAAATGGVASLGFDHFWRQFHFLAFTNDLWQLNPARDHLIQMFPQDFWFDITVLIGAFTLLQVFLIGGAAALYLYLTRSQREWDEQPESRVPLARPLEPSPRVPPPRPRHLTR
jgi:integral membrane protein (TIGR01906 family)